MARSKCYLLLGEPRSALADAEAALQLDPKHVQALLHKAEALYYCGEFELSLVHYHRGLRTRPDLHAFRLGVQKAQVSCNMVVVICIAKAIPLNVVNSKSIDGVEMHLIRYPCRYLHQNSLNLYLLTYRLPAR